MLSHKLDVGCQSLQQIWSRLKRVLLELRKGIGHSKRSFALRGGTQRSVPRSVLGGIQRISIAAQRHPEFVTKSFTECPCVRPG